MSSCIRKLTAAPRVVSVFSRRHFHTGLANASSAQPIPTPSPDNAEKVYSEKIKTIVDGISKLTLVEVADLNDLLKKTLNIDDSLLAAPVAVQAGTAPTKADNADEAKDNRTSFTVKLIKIDASKKVPVIKAVKGLIEGMNLVQAKKFVESAPQVIRADIGKEEAEKIKKDLEESGASVEIV